MKQILRLLSRTPLPLLYILSSAVAPFLYHVVRYRRRVVRENLLLSFPERTKAQIRHIERKFYQFFCDYAVETLKLLTITPEEMRRRMTFSGHEQMQQDCAQHGFVVLYLGHYGNWEWISTLPLWTTHPDVHSAQLYRPLKSERMDALFNQMRTRFHSENIPKNSVLRRMVEMRRDGEKTLIGFISDQSPSPNNIHAYTTFLHQRTAMLTGAETIAKKFKAPVWFASVTRPERGHYHCHFEPLLPSPAHLTPQTLDDYQLTEHYLHRLEQMICAAPHLWLWTHRRWKHTRAQRRGK